MYFDPWNASHMKDVILEFKNKPEFASHMVEGGAQMIRRTYQSWDDVALQTCKEMQDIVAASQ